MNLQEKNWTMSDCSNPDTEHGGRYGMIEIREEGRVVALVPPYENEYTFTHEESLIHARAINNVPDMVRILEKLTSDNLSESELAHLRFRASVVLDELKGELIIN